MEAQLYEDGKFPFTPEWYRGREHAPHREQAPHWARLDRAAEYIDEAVEVYGAESIVDLGAGDGGLLATIRSDVPKWGYDLLKDNATYGQHFRCVDVRHADFLKTNIEWADLVVCTEVLEHLEYPHDLVRRISSNARFLVASSPASETRESHSPEHAWAWDMAGYRQMLRFSGFNNVIEHATVFNGDMAFQVVLARASAAM